MSNWNQPHKFQKDEYDKARELWLCKCGLPKAIASLHGIAKKQKIKITFELIQVLDDLCSEDDLLKDYGGDVFKLVKYLYDNEGCWWDGELKLVKTELV